MYRDFAKRRADKLGIAGTVENLSDGTVAVVAEGDEEKLKEYLGDLKKGPILAKVISIEAEWLTPGGTFKDFRILYYGR